MLHTFTVKGDGLIEVLGRIDAAIAARSDQPLELIVEPSTPGAVPMEISA